MGSNSAAGCDCPRCGHKLQSREYADMSVEECDDCGGLFLAPDMLERLVAAHDAPTGMRLALPKREFKRETSVRYIHCPVCRKMMNRQAFARISGIVIDVCKSHGLWFDGGELAEVVRFVESGGLERAREREISELTERQRQSRTEMAIAEATGALDLETDSPGFSIRWRSGSGSGVFADLLHAIVRAWK